MKRLLAGLALALLIVSPVAAAPVSVSFSLTTASPATFSVTRSAPDSEVWWVTVDCFAADGSPVPIGYLDDEGNFHPDDDRVVIWGTSLTGYTEPLAVAGASCVARLTQTPWRVKHNDPSLVF